MTHSITQHIAAHGAKTPWAIAAQFRRTEDEVRFHLRIMVQEGLLRKDKFERYDLRG